MDVFERFTMPPACIAIESWIATDLEAERGHGRLKRASTTPARRARYAQPVYPLRHEVHLRLIIELAGKYWLPAVCPLRYHEEAGGSLSYGVNGFDLVPR